MDSSTPNSPAELVKLNREAKLNRCELSDIIDAYCTKKEIVPDSELLAGVLRILTQMCAEHRMVIDGLGPDVPFSVRDPWVHDYRKLVKAAELLSTITPECEADE